MAYIDGILVAVPAANKAAYRDDAETMSVIFRAHGAIGGTWCWADEALEDAPAGMVNSFAAAARPAAGEVAAFGWMVWPSKSVRDAGWAAIATDPRMAPDALAMPFDVTRMLTGGFHAVYDFGAGEAIAGED